jgi:hypothetical protein|tara:strand:- start:313 stop:465 length:153 start_codon:yes stop_codon:yes gene_type:complete
MKKQIKAPTGFHFMVDGKNIKLMKNPPGGFKPHKGAKLSISFDVVKAHSK